MRWLVVALLTCTTCNPPPRLFVVEEMASYRPGYELPRFASVEGVLSVLDGMEFVDDHVDYVQHPTSMQARGKGDCEDFAFYFASAVVGSGLLPPGGVFLVEVRWSDGGHMAAVYAQGGAWWMQRNCRGCVPAKLGRLEGFVGELERREGRRASSARYHRVTKVDIRGTVFPGEAVDVPTTSP